MATRLREPHSAIVTCSAAGIAATEPSCYFVQAKSNTFARLEQALPRCL